MESEERREKPPLGVKPFYIAASQRIAELADAIQRNAGTDDTQMLMRWANEIVLQVRIIDLLK